jgi:aspartate ammonia-lyase
MQTRIEKDSLGECNIAANAYYGVQTVRAIENFLCLVRDPQRDWRRSHCHNCSPVLPSCRAR